MLDPYTGNYINNFDPLYDIISQFASFHNLLLSYYTKCPLFMKNTTITVVSHFLLIIFHLTRWKFKNPYYKMELDYLFMTRILIITNMHNKRKR